MKTFLEEARAAGRLNHPNVVAVYHAGQGGDVTYISMEYLEGGSIEELKARCLEETGLPPPRPPEAGRGARGRRA